MTDSSSSEAVDPVVAVLEALGRWWNYELFEDEREDPRNAAVWEEVVKHYPPGCAIPGCSGGRMNWPYGAYCRRHTKELIGG